MMRKSDPVDCSWNGTTTRGRACLLTWMEKMRLAQAFVRKMPPRGEIVVDEQTEEEYHVECGRTTFIYHN